MQSLKQYRIAFQMTMVVLYPTVIQPLFNKLSPLAEGTLRSRIERLAGALNFPLTHLYEIDGSKRSAHSNAYFFGLPWAKHIVLYDTLIKQSKEEEVEAVLAHELGHWFYSHPTKLLLISQCHIFAILAFYPVFRHSPLFVRSFGFSSSVAAHPPLIVSFLLYQVSDSGGPLDQIIDAPADALEPCGVPRWPIHELRNAPFRVASGRVRDCASQQNCA